MLKNRKDKKMASRIRTDNQLLQLTQEMRKKMEKSDNELHTELANLNQVITNICSSIQQSVGIIGQYPQFFIMLEISYQTYMLEISY